MIYIQHPFPNIISKTYANIFVQRLFLLIIFFTLIGIKSNIMECQLSLDLSCPPSVTGSSQALLHDTYTLSKGIALFHGQTIRFRNHRYDVDNLWQLFQHDNVNRLEAKERKKRMNITWWKGGDGGLKNVRMTGWCNKEQATMNTRIGNVTITLSCQFLSQVGWVLILDVFDNRFPADDDDSFNMS